MKKKFILLLFTFFLMSFANAAPVEKIETDFAKRLMSYEVMNVWFNAIHIFAENPNAHFQVCFMLGKLMGRLEAIELSDSLTKVELYRNEITTSKYFLDAMFKFGICSSEERKQLSVSTMNERFYERAFSISSIE